MTLPDERTKITLKTLLELASPFGRATDLHETVEYSFTGSFL